MFSGKGLHLLMRKLFTGISVPLQKNGFSRIAGMPDEERNMWCFFPRERDWPGNLHTSFQG
jgi:hypothetical protein